jgi:hypothetical protein
LTKVIESTGCALAAVLEAGAVDPVAGGGVGSGGVAGCGVLADESGTTEAAVATTATVADERRAVATATTVTAGMEGIPVGTGAATAAVPDEETGVAAITACGPHRSGAIAIATATDQQPAVGAVGIERRAVGAVADEDVEDRNAAGQIK